MPDLDVSRVRALVGCSHYHQQAGRQPGGNCLGPGQEKVELVTEGRGWIQDQGAMIEVDPGALIWQLPGERMICRSDDAAPYSCLAIAWEVSAPRRQVPRVTRWDDRAEILAYTAQLVEAWSDHRIDRQLLAVASYAHLLWRAHTSVATATDPDLPPPLRRVLTALGEDPARDWSVEAMAQTADWSPSRLHEAFRTHLRISPHRHLLELRLRTARELLATSGDDLSAIAVRCGLGSAAALCRHFRRSSGMTPGAYRRRQR